MKRIFGFWLLTTVLLTNTSIAAAQQAGKQHQLGYLAVRSGSGPLDEALKSRLRELGYVEGKNIEYVHRWANGNFDRLPAIAEELVHRKVDVIVTETSAAAQAAKKLAKLFPS